METDPDTWDGWYPMFNAGESDQYVATLKKDQAYEIHLELDWSDPRMPKDISIIAQGVDGGDIEITHWKGIESAKLPLIGRK